MAAPIGIVLLTYERTEYAIRTIEAAAARLRYPDIRWFVSDDGSRPEHLTEIVDKLVQLNQTVSGSFSQRSSYGSIANAGIRYLYDEEGVRLFLMLEDDWELLNVLDLWQYAELLVEREDIGAVRMGYLNNSLRGHLTGHRDRLYWALDDRDSRNRSSYAWAGHPALVHARHFLVHGFYPEMLQPGETELAMANQYSYNPPHPMIVWPVHLGEAGPWGHIGTVQSYTWNGGLRLEHVSV